VSTKGDFVHKNPEARVNKKHEVIKKKTSQILRPASTQPCHIYAINRFQFYTLSGCELRIKNLHFNHNYLDLIQF
jgi:hypothetical protein